MRPSDNAKITQSKVAVKKDDAMNISLFLDGNYTTLFMNHFNGNDMPKTEHTSRSTETNLPRMTRITMQFLSQSVHVRQRPLPSGREREIRRNETHFARCGGARCGRSMAALVSFPASAGGSVRPVATLKIAHSACIRIAAGTCLHEQPSDGKVRETVSATAVAAVAAIIRAVVTHGCVAQLLFYRIHFIQFSL